MMQRLVCHLSRISDREQALCERFNRAAERRGVRRLFAAVSRLGDGIFWYGLMLALLLKDGPAAAPAVLHMLAVGFASLLLYKWLKGKTLRPRPYQVNAAINASVPPLDQFSFPSGHTLHAVAFTIVLLAYYPALAWIAVPFTFLVAISRLVLGLHYPSDVLAGALIGTTMASVSFGFL